MFSIVWQAFKAYTWIAYNSWKKQLNRNIWGVSVNKSYRPTTIHPISNEHGFSVHSHSKTSWCCSQMKQSVFNQLTHTLAHTHTHTHTHTHARSYCNNTLIPPLQFISLQSSNPPFCGKAYESILKCPPRKMNWQKSNPKHTPWFNGKNMKKKKSYSWFMF